MIREFRDVFEAVVQNLEADIEHVQPPVPTEQVDQT